MFHESKKEAKDALMMIYSNIQTFRIYQTFGESIPSLIFDLTLCIGNPVAWGYCRTYPTNHTVYSLQEFVSFLPANLSNPDKPSCPEDFSNIEYKYDSKKYDINIIIKINKCLISIKYYSRNKSSSQKMYRV